MVFRVAKKHCGDLLSSNTAARIPKMDIADENDLLA
jgi:hypothetical protein